MSQRLAAFNRGFAEHSARTEQDFVELGRLLRRLYSAAMELTDLVGKRAGALRGALERSHLAGADGLAAQSLRELRSILEETSGRLSSLGEVGSALHQLQARVRGIERIGVFLKSSAVSFAIESCRTGECQQAFGAFVEELRTLATRVASLGQDISQEVQTTQESQARGLHGLRSGLEEMRQLTQQLETTANTTAGEAQQLLDDAFGALREAEERARQIAHHADQAVYYLQFGDLIRQKCEHILAALEEAADLLAEGNSRGDWSAQAAAVDRVLIIQVSQVELVREEVVTAQSKLTASLQSIAEETNHLAEALESGQVTSRTPGVATDPLRALTLDSLRLEELRQQGRGLGQQARVTAREAVEASAQLAQHCERVKDINLEMHLQALNAIIKTVALGGRGATLEVLSCQVDRLCSESSQEVADILATLETILRHAQAMVPAGISNQEEPPATAEAESALRAGLERITDAYEAFRQTSREAGALAQQQQTALASGGAELHFLAGLAAILTEQARELASLRQSLAPWKAGVKTPPAEAVAALDQRYTMQSEREIHQRASETISPAATPASSPPRDGNLELFETITASPPADAPPSPAPEPAGSDTDQKAKLTPATARVTDPALGDNVELF